MEQSQQQSAHGAGERGAWRYPTAWPDHLLKTFPGVVTSPTWRPMSRKGDPKDPRPLRLEQLHSMRRDEQGRFNQLEGGKPALTEDAYELLQNAVDDMRAAGGVANLIPELPRAQSLVETIDPEAIEAAMEKLKADKPRLWEILRFFQTPPRLRDFDTPEAFAAWGLDPPTNRAGLYRERRWALYGVWANLPLAERKKAAGEE